MKNRKEYNDRWSYPLINPSFTLGEYEEMRNKEKKKCNCFPDWHTGRNHHPYCPKFELYFGFTKRDFREE